jgi:hypothetical protein
MQTRQLHEDAVERGAVGKFVERSLAKTVVVKMKKGVGVVD